MGQDDMNEWIPVTSQNTSAVKDAESGKQFAVGYVSVKGEEAGTATLLIGQTIVWRGRFPAGGSDGQYFGPLGIRNGENTGEAITLVVTTSGNYEANFGYRVIREVFA